MVVWPTSELPIWPAGRPTASPDAVSVRVGKPLQQLRVGRRARKLDSVVFFSSRSPQPSRNDEDERTACGHHRARELAMALRPAYLPALPSASSMRSSWLYFATRSVRLAEPVLICPALVATARSAMVASSVSPERCEMIVRVARGARHGHGVERFGDRADLIQLDEDRVGDALRRCRA